jgi:enoyl-CoA hydratase
VAEVVPAGDLLKRAHALLDRMSRSGPLALRLTKLVADAPAGHPIADDLAQAILVEADDKRARMDAFLAGERT